MRDIKGAINPMDIGVYFLKVTFWGFRKVHKSLPHLPSLAKLQVFCKVQMLCPSKGCEVMTGARESYRSLKMYNSLKDIPSKTLQAELVKRGYNLTRKREYETPAEIIKLG